MRRLCTPTEWPEFNVVVFAALLNFPWEILQIPFFSDMPTTPHWDAVKICTVATLGDALITLGAYWLVALRAGRHWFTRPTAGQLAIFVTAGLVVTAVIERLAQSGAWMDGWSYSERMPMVPLIGVGLIPLLQWVLLPPLTVWFCRRQLGLAGHRKRAR